VDGVETSDGRHAVRAVLLPVAADWPSRKALFGALLAGLVPLLLAITSIVVAVALAALVGQGFALSVFVVNMITGMGLALGIDYALFVLSRFREERARGRPTVDAVSTAGATASRAVLFSGLAFALAMVGMVLVPDTLLRSLAVGAIIVGAVSVAAAMLTALTGAVADVFRRGPEGG
jgi:RND superfamily putative drug exporter